MSDDAELFTVGRLARRTGLPVHTIRFWADSGVVAEARRSAGGYRLFDAAAVARFELVKTLRELGIGLEDIQRILTRRVTVAPPNAPGSRPGWPSWPTPRSSATGTSWRP
ncbi:hypothetical protein Aph01nite_26700 [Acrocarpospora phusangensis]|uniref:HTH merR-type domain-containing protein n=1 Tax=Acrocarpospora phusangensis TaxID=1070424 RepID=A0A919QBL0_9ACTN|nr:MerR family transcriptional regulator [Acrocarpospora phusangensis]GIH24360.1 hypothetical protein Aph01nite_26700 [Acrocarpospora phusangensis]